MKKILSILLATTIGFQGAFASVPFYQDLDNWIVLDSGLGPSHNKISSNSFKEIEKNIKNFNDIGDKLQISPRLIASQCFAEKVRQTNSYRANIRRQIEGSFIKDIISGMGLHNFSEGLCSIKPYVALKIQGYLKNKKSDYYLGEHFEKMLDYKTGVDGTEELVKTRLLDDKWNILYAGIYLKMFQTQWAKRGFPIADKVDIISTLYNLGFYKSKPHANPGVGGAYTKISYIDENGVEKIKELYFGEIALSFYESNIFSDIRKKYENKILDEDLIQPKFKSIMKKYIDLGIIKGSNSLVKPQNKVNRAEFLAILFRQLNEEPDGGNCYFGDIKEKDWFYGYVCKSFEKGIIKGYGNGKFGPGDNLTLEQILIIMSRVIGQDLNKEQIIGFQKDNFDFTDLSKKITREETVFLLSKIPEIEDGIKSGVFKSTKKIIIGETIKGTPINAYYRRGKEDFIGIFANIHGGYESGAFDTANYLLEELEKSNKDSWFIIPTINPDGLKIKSVYGRTNSNRVNLNRNFCTKNFLDKTNIKKGVKSLSSVGGKCNSELETLAVKSVLEKFKFKEIYSLHTEGGVFFIPDGSFEDKRVTSLGDKLKTFLPEYKWNLNYSTEKEKRQRIFDFEIDEGGSNKFTGTMETYIYETTNTPTILIEIMKHNQTEKRLVSIFD